VTLQVVIIAHGNGIAAFRRHEKFWKALEAPILVVAPEDDPVETSHEKLTFGLAQRNGRDSIKRLHALFDWLSVREWERCVIYEYDSFSLLPTLPTGGGLHGIVFHNNESPKFMSPRYVNPPWCFDRAAFYALHAKAKAYPTLYEQGEADRWISALAFLAGVPLFDYEPKGFSRGMITSGDVGGLTHAIKELHAIHFHGCKQEWVLRAIEQFYDESHPGGTPLPR
jgi:hypothetical protein